MKHFVNSSSLRDVLLDVQRPAAFVVGILAGLLFIRVLKKAMEMLEPIPTLDVPMMEGEVLETKLDRGQGTPF